METLAMTQAERRRLEVLGLVRADKLSLKRASELLGISYRQTKRVWQRFQALGDVGLVHQLRGRPSNRPSNAALKDAVLARYVASYSDYGPTLAAEALAEEGLIVPVQTLRRWLVSAGLWARQRQRKQHRRRRERRAHFGELVQMDGSHHDWFEGRRGEAVLMVMIDDATGRITARFFEEETLSAAFTMLLDYAPRSGLPHALYVDRAGIYRSDREPTEEEILAGKRPQTQFVRALESLGVQLILARSPQAKGRVERMNRTLQDRLVKALRQRGISALETANQFLDAEFLAPFNAKFSKVAAQPADVHRAVGAKVDLGSVLAVHEPRVVQNDWTIRWHNGFLQLGRECGVQAGQSVLVCEPVTGPVRLFQGTRELSYGTTCTEPKARSKTKIRRGPIKSSQGQKPGKKHPWRRAVVPACVPTSVVAAGLGVGCGASFATLPALRNPPPTRYSKE